MDKKILLTGFAPFGGENVNPSMEAVRGIKETACVIRAELPVAFRTAPGEIMRLMDAHRPDVVLCVGQAGGRDKMTIERVGINWMRGRIPDNEGFVPADGPLVPGGKAAYFSTLPVADLTRAMLDAGVPADESLSAGGYVCNAVLYTALRFAEEQNLKTRCGFLHVPYLPEQTLSSPAGGRCPSLPLAEMIRGLEAVLAVLAQ